MKLYTALFVVVVLVVAMAAGKNLRSRYLDLKCPRVCSRLYRPVCATLNGLPVSISNYCILENLISCESTDNKIWEYVHSGSCQSEEEISEEDAELEPALNNELVEYEEDDLSQVDDNQIDEVIHWSLDYELQQE